MKNEQPLPPHNRKAEQSVLCGIFRVNEQYDEVARKLSPEDFYFDAHARIFHAMGNLRAENKPLEMVAVLEELKAQGRAEDIGGAAYLAELWEIDPTGAYCQQHAEIVRDKASRRRLLALCNEISRDIVDEVEAAEELVSRFENRIFAIGNTASTEEPKHIGEAMVELCDDIDARLRGEAEAFIPTGLQQLDQLIGGLRAGQLIVLGARPSVGKSALGLKYAINAALIRRVPVLVFSLEMEAKEWAARVMSGHGGIALNTITGSKDIPQATRSVIGNVLHEYQRVPLWIDERCDHSVDTIAATARRAVRKHGVGLLVIDYLQLIDHGHHGKNETDRIGETTRRLKVLARSLKVPVVLLCQLNRECEKRPDGQPTMADFRGSGNIEQDADVAFLLWPVDVTEGDAMPPIQEIRIVVGKQRNGPRGVAHVEYVRAFTRFQDALPRM